jgi:GH25 family lysozyme M1 (1,4-beta-N-acetylmuramidase)
MKWRRQGVDVSMWQGSIDWKAAADRVAFAFCKSTQGTNWVDPTFNPARVAALRGAGIRFGPYHFADNSSTDGFAEADHFIQVATAAGWKPGHDLPGVLDIESGVGGRVGVRFVRRFVKRYRRRTGHRPIIYTGSFWRDALTNPLILSRCPLWLAAYTPTWHGWVPRAWKKPHIWQHTDAFSCPGVSAPCDGDRYLRSRRSFERLGLA